MNLTDEQKRELREKVSRLAGWYPSIYPLTRDNVDDAINEVFGKRSGYYDRAFIIALQDIMNLEEIGMIDLRDAFTLTMATAAQRAQAFVRVMEGES